MDRLVRSQRHALGGRAAGTTNRLYKNNRDGTFTDVTTKAGLLRTGWASAVTVGDYDNDGFDDLFITYYGQNVLYHNNGDGTFTDVTERAGLGQDGSPLRVWLHLAGLRSRWTTRSFRRELPQHHSREVAQARRKLRLHLEGSPGQLWAPRSSTGFVQLFHNNGDGTFTEVSKASASRQRPALIP